MRGELKHSLAEPTRIPTFFPPGGDPNQAYEYHLGVAIISMLFGLIHCLGWSLIFPSGAERLIWRVSAVIISALPVFVLYSYSILLFFLPIIKSLRVGDTIRFPGRSLHLFIRWVAIPAGRFRIDSDISFGSDSSASGGGLPFITEPPTRSILSS